MAVCSEEEPEVRTGLKKQAYEAKEHAKSMSQSFTTNKVTAGTIQAMAKRVSGFAPRHSSF